MNERHLRLGAFALAVAADLAGCADILGFPDAEIGSAGSGGGAVCTPGATKDCYSGDPVTRDKGVCHGGVRVCKADGSGFDDACTGEVLPAEENCAAAGDEDCNGLADGADPACACAPGAAAACYTGPPGTRDVGACTSGTMTCNADGKGYGACTGEGQAGFQSCTAGAADTDCDHIAGCTGAYRWAREFGDAMDQGASAVAIRAGDRHVFVTGSIAGSVDFGGGALAGAAADPYVLELDEHGGYVDATRFQTAGGAGNAVAVDAKGAVIVGGDATGFGDAGIGSGVFVAKRDATGASVFTVVVPASALTHLHGVAADSNDDNVVVAGEFDATIDFGCNGGPMTSAGSLDIFVAKLDATSGACVWQRQFGGAGNQIARAVAVGGMDEIAITGTFDGPLQFDATADLTRPIVVNDGYVFIAKLDTTGLGQWGVAAGDAPPGFAIGNAVKMDENGAVYVAGHFRGNVDLGGGPLASAGNNDALVAVRDPSGAHLYAKRFGGPVDDQGWGIAVDAEHNVTVAVVFNDTVDFGTGPLSPTTGYDTAIVKLDPMAQTIWVKRFGGNAFQYPYGLAAGPFGEIAVALRNGGTGDFGGGPVATMGRGDAVVVELAP